MLKKNSNLLKIQNMWTVHLSKILEILKIKSVINIPSEGFSEMFEKKTFIFLNYLKKKIQLHYGSKIYFCINNKQTVKINYTV